MKLMMVPLLLSHCLVIKLMTCYSSDRNFGTKLLLLVLMQAHLVFVLAALNFKIFGFKKTCLSDPAVLDIDHGLLAKMH